MSRTRFSRFLSPLAALLAVLLLASAAGCSSAGEENSPSPSPSATAPTRTGGSGLTLPTLEGAETLSIIRPGRERYRQTAAFRRSRAPRLSVRGRSSTPICGWSAPPGEGPPCW